MGRLLIKFPTRNRPDKFKTVFERYIRLLSGRHEVRFVVTMDADDPTMNNPAMRHWLDTRPVDLKYRYGASRSKIEAVNADLDGETADVLLLASDDMIPQVGGYDAVIFEAFKAFPGYFGAVRFWDGLRAPDDPLMTLAVLGWPLYRAMGHLYHPDYLSLYADCEQTDVCRKLGVLVQHPSCIVRHAWTSHLFDALHARNEGQAMYEHDLSTYRRRAAQNFDVQRIRDAMPPAAPPAPPVIDIARAAALPGWMTPPELLFLARAACRSRSILELGSWKGRSSRVLADHMQPGGRLVCLDHWRGSAGEPGKHREAKEDRGDKVYMDFLAHMRDHVAAGRVLPLRMDTINGFHALRAAGEKFDMIFVDASHEYQDVMRDIVCALPLLNRGGLICGHDHCAGWPGVVGAVTTALGGQAEVMAGGTIWSWRDPRRVGPRDAGAAAVDAPPAGKQRIPKIIHTCWMSGDPLPPLQQKCLESWKRCLPDYEIRIWDAKNWDTGKFRFAKEAYERKQWAFVSDVLRLDVMHDMGGIYLDFDVEVMKTFDPLLGHAFFTGSERTCHIRTNTPYIMGCEKGSALVKELLGFYDGKSFVRPDGTFERTTNTTHIHFTMMKQGGVNTDEHHEFMPGHVKYPGHIIGYASSESYAVHHFNGAWRELPDRAEVPLDRTFDEIHRKSAWGNGSGPGSSPRYTEGYRAFLQAYLAENNIKSVLDIGCGDWRFSRLMDWSGIDYVGVDVAASCVEGNTRNHQRPNVRFLRANAVTEDLPKADLVIVKDVLQHLSLKNACAVVDRLRDRDRVLIVQDAMDAGANAECMDGGCRPLDMSKPPFGLRVSPVFRFGQGGKVAHEWRPAMHVDLAIVQATIAALKTVEKSVDLVRYGPNSDGGYVVPNLKYTRCVSIGVGTDVRFEAHLGRTMPVRFFLHDPTIPAAPPLANSVFHRIGLGRGPGRLPLPELLARCGMAENDTTLLKIDCEGGEWEGDLQHADLSRVDAIAIELHDLHMLDRYPIYNEVLRRIRRDFACVNVHPNNYGGTFEFMGEAIPRVLELTFVAKRHLGALAGISKELNHPNSPNLPDIRFPVNP